MGEVGGRGYCTLHVEWADGQTYRHTDIGIVFMFSQLSGNGSNSVMSLPLRPYILRRRDGWGDGRGDGRGDGQTDGQTDGRADVETEAWTDGFELCCLVRVLRGIVLGSAGMFREFLGLG